MRIAHLRLGIRGLIDGRHPRVLTGKMRSTRGMSLDSVRILGYEYRNWMSESPESEDSACGFFAING
jgi:hypothetical protein